MTDPAKLYRLGDILTFGKHKGQTVRRVIATDPEYLEWATDEFLELDSEAEDALEDAMLDFRED